MSMIIKKRDNSIKNIRKVAVSFLLLFCSVCLVSAQKEERKQVRSGNSLYKSEKFTESEVAYRKALDVNPRSIEGTYNLGNSLYKQKKFQEAAEQYQLLAGQAEKVMETKDGQTKMAEVFHNLGNVCMQAKDYGKSIAAYRQSLRLNPSELRNCTKINRMKIKARRRRRINKKIRITKMISNSSNNSSKMISNKIRRKNRNNRMSK